MFRTPTAQLAVNGGSQHPEKRKAGGHGPTLADEVEHLLPTPTSSVDSGGLKPDGTQYGPTSGTTLTDATVRWGDYAPAIARWEHVTGNPAPPPTETGPKGTPRLSPKFVEWMMGLAPGHITDVDITRSAQLKAGGNGVVPQQAEAAIRHLLAVDELEAVAS